MKTKLLNLAAALLMLAPLANATTIEWGSSVGDNLFDSHATALDESFTFELGSFGSFVPDFSNIELWSANWKPFDQASTGTLPVTWSPLDGFFSSSADLVPGVGGATSSASPPLPSFTFAPGEQMFIWAFNTKNLAANTTEWALVTNDLTDGITADDWLFPAVGDHSNVPIKWRLPISTHVIFGGLNNMDGPGDFTPPGTDFQLQTHTVSVVPEPSSALMIAATGLLLRRRRRTC